MERRPTSITIISWFLIISAVLSFVATALTYNHPDVVRLMELNALPVPVQFAMIAIGSVITLACGVLMLKGRKIGRTAYVAWGVIAMGIGLVSSPAPATMIPSMGFLLVVVVFLFLPKANAYFSPSHEARSEEPSSDA